MQTAPKVLAEKLLIPSDDVIKLNSDQQRATITTKVQHKKLHPTLRTSLTETKSTQPQKRKMKTGADTEASTARRLTLRSSKVDGVEEGSEKIGRTTVGSSKVDVDEEESGELTVKAMEKAEK